MVLGSRVRKEHAHAVEIGGQGGGGYETNFGRAVVAQRVDETRVSIGQERVPVAYDCASLVERLLRGLKCAEQTAESGDANSGVRFFDLKLSWRGRARVVRGRCCRVRVILGACPTTRRFFSLFSTLFFKIQNFY